MISVKSFATNARGVGILSRLTSIEAACCACVPDVAREAVIAGAFGSEYNARFNAAAWLL
jgi:hypothetical protein